MEAFRAAQSSFSPELVAAAEQAGMIPSTMVVYIKKQTVLVRDAHAPYPAFNEALTGVAQGT